MISKRWIWLAVLILLLGGLSLAGCKSREPYVGKYQSFEPPIEGGPITLELKANGEGVWTLGEQRVPFRWEVKKEKIWLHTKGGGVLIGTPVADELTLDLSGDLRACCPVQNMVKFKRLPEAG
jgi:hypothetical protein